MVTVAAWLDLNPTSSNVTNTLTITCNVCKIAMNTASIPALANIYFDIGQTIETVTFLDWSNSYESQCGRFNSMTAKFNSNST